MTLLDVILGLVLVGFLVAGLARGVWATIGGAAGFLVGAVAAFFAMPLVAGWVSDPVWRTVAVIGCAIVVVLAGHALGSAAGREIQRSVRSPAVQTLSSLIGGVLNLVVAGVVIAALSFSIQAMGFPQVNQHMKQSMVLRGIDYLVPDRVESMFAEVRSVVLDSDIPELTQLLVPDAEPLPQSIDGELSEAAAVTAESVARISGIAHQCGQSQSGSGVAISPNRVVTNAHVLAGVSDVSVEMPDGQVRTGRVVLFDSSRDLALVAVDTLDAGAASVGGPMETGEEGYVMGYPAGGPFNAGPAVVQARGESAVNNIYGGASSEVEVYQLNANVRQGNSGGPLVNTDGEVTGIIFARSVEGSSVGFAVTAEQAGDVLTAPDSFTDTVSTGECVSR